MADLPIVFYQVMTRSLPEAIGPLLEKCLERDWTVEVLCPDEARLMKLDQDLWQLKDDSWLPHGIFGDGTEADQPVLLAPNQTQANSPKALMLLGHAPLGDFTGLERVMVVFDGTIADELAHARSLWKSAGGDGRILSYWEEGPERNWIKKV